MYSKAVALLNTIAGCQVMLDLLEASVVRGHSVSSTAANPVARGTLFTCSAPQILEARLRDQCPSPKQPRQILHIDRTFTRSLDRYTVDSTEFPVTRMTAVRKNCGHRNIFSNSDIRAPILFNDQRTPR